MSPEPVATYASPVVEIVSHTTPGRLNEDAWIALPAGALDQRTVIAAIDGATTRLTPPPLQRHLDTLPERLTPAAFSARLVRDSLLGQIVAGPLPDLRTLALHANAALGRALTTIFGDLTLEALQFPPEVYATLAHDPRLIRLGLPASVMTLAQVELAENTLHYAHMGDTLLLVAYQDGRVEVPTLSGLDDSERGIKQHILAARQADPDRSLRELTQSPEVRRFNLNSGLRHNFVDEHGLPQPAQGIGVLDGLPELRYFVQTDSLALTGVAFVCVLSDGLEWHASAEEIFTEDADHAADLQQQRFAKMAREIETRGLNGYLRLLRDTERADADHERFPRMKTHDDATGVLLRFADVTGAL